MEIDKFEDIDAWQLESDIFSMTSKGNFVKDYGLRDQIQRASVSVMANIARPVE